MEDGLGSADPLKREEHTLAGESAEDAVNVVELELVEVVLDVGDEAVRAEKLGASFAESFLLGALLVVDVLEEVLHVLLHDLDVCVLGLDLGRDKVAGASEIEGLGAQALALFVHVLVVGVTDDFTVNVHAHFLDAIEGDDVLERSRLGNVVRVGGNIAVVLEVRKINPNAHFGRWVL